MIDRAFIDTTGRAPTTDSACPFEHERVLATRLQRTRERQAGDVIDSHGVQIAFLNTSNVGTACNYTHTVMRMKLHTQ